MKRRYRDLAERSFAKGSLLSKLEKSKHADNKSEFKTMTIPSRN